MNTTHLQITGGKVLIDLEDYEYLSSFSWYVGSHGYPVRTVQIGKREDYTKETIFLHNAVMPLPEPGMEIDHINKNKLDARKINLRFVSRSQNGFNRHTQSNNTSGCKGVNQRKDNGKWDASITIMGKKKSLGSYNSFGEAVNARRDFEKEHKLCP